MWTMWTSWVDLCPCIDLSVRSYPCVFPSRFPLDNAALLAQWLKAVGRPNWHPRLGSSVCSTHFTEDCFDLSVEKVAVRPDAVPTLMVHGDSAVKAQ